MKSGASLAISDNVNVLIATSETITVDAGASMTIGAASMVIYNNAGGPYGLNVAGTVTTTVNTSQAQFVTTGAIE